MTDHSREEREALGRQLWLKLLRKNHRRIPTDFQNELIGGETIGLAPQAAASHGFDSDGRSCPVRWTAH